MFGKKKNDDMGQPIKPIKDNIVGAAVDFNFLPQWSIKNDNGPLREEMIIAEAERRALEADKKKEKGPWDMKTMLMIMVGLGVIYLLVSSSWKYMGDLDTAQKTLATKSDAYMQCNTQLMIYQNACPAIYGIITAGNSTRNADGSGGSGGGGTLHG
jgi:hypothetical protein